MAKYQDKYYVYYPKRDGKLSTSIKNGSKYINDIVAVKKNYPHFFISELLAVIVLAIYGFWRKVTLKKNKLYFQFKYMGIFPDLKCVADFVSVLVFVITKVFIIS